MRKPEILGSLRSSYTRVVCMVCEEKGVEYVLTETMLGAPELRHIHPFGKMPVLRHGDLELCESKAIATYIDRSFSGPQLIPGDPRLAGFTEQWVSLVNTVMDVTLIRTYLLAYAAPRTTDGKPDRKIIDAVTPAVRQQLGILDEAVAETGYLVGDQFTLADINLQPTSICCRSSITFDNCQKVLSPWALRRISDATMSVTRRARALSAQLRLRARQDGHRQTKASSSSFRDDIPT